MLCLSIFLFQNIWSGLSLRQLRRPTSQRGKRGNILLGVGGSIQLCNYVCESQSQDTWSKELLVLRSFINLSILVMFIIHSTALVIIFIERLKCSAFSLIHIWRILLSGLSSHYLSNLIYIDKSDIILSYHKLIRCNFPYLLKNTLDIKSIWKK